MTPKGSQPVARNNKMPHDPEGVAAGDPHGRYFGSNSPHARVAQTLHRVGRARLAALARQPRVHHLIAESVGQGVGEHARQPAEGHIAQVADGEDLLAASRAAQRHHQWCHVQVAACESAVELELRAVLLFVPDHKAHRLIPACGREGPVLFLEPESTSVRLRQARSMHRKAVPAFGAG